MIMKTLNSICSSPDYLKLFNHKKSRYWDINFPGQNIYTTELGVLSVISNLTKKNSKNFYCMSDDSKQF